MSTSYPVPEPAPLKIRVLGRMVVRRPDGSRVQGALWGRTKVRCLLALLVLQEHHYLHREEIIDYLWPDNQRKAALANLNNTVYSLRKCLEPDLASGADSSYIQYQQGGYYALNDQEPLWIDKCCFQAFLCKARTTPSYSESRQLYEQALDLYRGDLLAGLAPIAPFFEDERMRLRMLYCEAMENLAALHEHEARPDEAIILYLKILAIDPGRDSAAFRLLNLALQREDLPLALPHIKHFQQVSP